MALLRCRACCKKGPEERWDFFPSLEIGKGFVVSKPCTSSFCMHPPHMESRSLSPFAASKLITRRASAAERMSSGRWETKALWPVSVSDQILRAACFLLIALLDECFHSISPSIKLSTHQRCLSLSDRCICYNGQRVFRACQSNPRLYFSWADSREKWKTNIERLL